MESDAKEVNDRHPCLALNLDVKKLVARLHVMCGSVNSCLSLVD